MYAGEKKEGLSAQKPPLTHCYMTHAWHEVKLCRSQNQAPRAAWPAQLSLEMGRLPSCDLAAYLRHESTPTCMQCNPALIQMEKLKLSAGGRTFKMHIVCKRADSLDGVSRAFFCFSLPVVIDDKIHIHCCICSLCLSEIFLSIYERLIHIHTEWFPYEEK